MTIRKPTIKIGSSKNGLRDLKHIEEQILNMGIMPDFGYDQDNYVLEMY